MAGGQQQQSIDLSVLSLEQLNQMKTQHEEEVQTLSGNFMKLRDAQGRLAQCIYSATASAASTPACISSISKVPLTQSLYVPGRIVEADKMMVDVGTGYYVQKDQQKTAEFLGRKVSFASTIRLPCVLLDEQSVVEMVDTYVRQGLSLRSIARQGC
ncbi:unnamed protein product [Ectocarpus fasciculatus]